MLEGVTLSVPGSVTRFTGTCPPDGAEVAGQLTEVISHLQGFVTESAMA
ncbi:hypothetical protein [Streptomyces sp. NPDC093094]